MTILKENVTNSGYVKSVALSLQSATRQEKVRKEIQVEKLQIKKIPMEKVQNINADAYS